MRAPGGHRPRCLRFFRNSVVIIQPASIGSECLYAIYMHEKAAASRSVSCAVGGGSLWSLGACNKASVLPFQMRIVERITQGLRAIWKERRGGTFQLHRPPSGSASCVMSLPLTGLR